MTTEWMPLYQTLLTVGGSLVVAFGTWIINDKTRVSKEKAEENKKFEEYKKELSKVIEANRLESNNQMEMVKDAINEIKASHQQSISLITLQLQNLEKKQDKHNSVIERTFLCEKEIEVLKNRESVSENRLADLERHEENRNG